MQYLSVPMPNTISVDGIYSVSKVNYNKKNVGIGESHNFPEINYILKGEHIAIIDGQLSKRSEGQLTITAPGSFHKSAGQTNSEGLIISFETPSSDVLECIYNMPIYLTESQENEFCEVVNIGLNLFKNREKGCGIGGMILKEGADNFELEKFKKRLELFLLDVYKCYAKPKSALSSRREFEFQSIKTYLLKNIEENLSAEEIADANLICLSKLKQIFKKKGGVKNYFITLKIERSKELIAEGKLNFTEIAEKLGFTSVHYFSKTFKKLTGITPSQYENGKGVYY